ncbi:MAG: peptidylprolyl isomerase [Candidatus Omnitrophica bacterium]|nr:peptidylprolyl isomerase [Candidatus Omnitrophota bacterium]
MTTRVISFHYTLTDEQGDTLDSSQGKQPLSFFEGRRQIIPGLEEKLIGMNVGDKDKIHVEAANAYGQRHEELMIELNRSQLPEGDLEPGMQLQTQKDGQVQIFVIAAINGDKVTLDGNHPLAGANLTFDVEITAIRPATAQELEHGHAHGPEGHDH